MFSTLALALVPALLATQTNASLTKAAATITAANIARHLDVMMADSLLGRDTPSRELDITARYVAEEFQKLGLQPFPRITSVQDWVQRYTLPGYLKVNYQKTFLRFGVGNPYVNVYFNSGKETDPKTHIKVSFSGGARFAAESIPASAADDIGLPTYLVAGPHTKASLQKVMDELQEVVVLYVPPARLDSGMQREIIDRIATLNHVVVIANEDTPTFIERRNAALERSVYVVDEYMEKTLGKESWVVSVQPDSIANLLLAAGIDVRQMRGSPTPLVRRVSSLDVTLQLRTVQADTTPATAPNVVALLRGTADRKQRKLWRGVDQYIAITAHMDRRGATSDNAPGVAALLELARAFSQPDARPTRSIIFLVTSGSERNFLGSSFWTQDLTSRPTSALTMAINLDNVGRNADSVVAINGLSDFEFVKRPEWIATEHPELGLKIVSGGSIANAESDHISFVRMRLPTLYVHDPVTADSAGAIDQDQLARIARLVFYIGQDLGSTKSSPRWTASGRQNRAIILGQ